MNQASHRAAVASGTSFSCWGRARAARPAPTAVSRALSLQASAAGTHGWCRVRPVPNSFTASSHWQGTFRSACLTLRVPQVGEFLHQAGAFGLRALNAVGGVRARFSSAQRCLGCSRLSQRRTSCHFSGQNISLCTSNLALKTLGQK